MVKFHVNKFWDKAVTAASYNRGKQLVNSVICGRWRWDCLDKFGAIVDSSLNRDFIHGFQIIWPSKYCSVFLKFVRLRYSKFSYKIRLFSFCAVFSKVHFYVNAVEKVHAKLNSMFKGHYFMCYSILDAFFNCILKNHTV